MKKFIVKGRLNSRSFKTPVIYLYKALGLSKLFPNSKRFGKYYLSYINEDAIHEVDAVIGAFLMIRRETVEQIGLLDECFFMYCEDEDWCFRAKREGREVTNILRFNILLSIRPYSFLQRKLFEEKKDQK